MDTRDCPICNKPLKYDDGDMLCITTAIDGCTLYYARGSEYNDPFVEYINYNKYSTIYYSGDNICEIYYVCRKSEPLLATYAGRIEYNEQRDTFIDNLLILV